MTTARKPSFEKIVRRSASRFSSAASGYKSGNAPKPRRNLSRIVRQTIDAPSSRAIE
jgi:hypothetical protein